MNIILSLIPKYAELIYSGEKSIEWRHTYPNKIIFSDVVYIYETAPVSRVTGSFKINPFIRPFFLNTETFKFLLPETQKNIERWGQVSIEYLKKYASRGPVWGWHIIDARRHVAMPLNSFNLKRPPQSWQYLKTNKEVTK